MKFSACGVEDMTNTFVMTLDIEGVGKSKNYTIDYFSTWNPMLSIIQNLAKGNPGKITYVDDENDQILLGSQSEWIEALKVAKKCKNRLELKLEDMDFTYDYKKLDIFGRECLGEYNPEHEPLAAFTKPKNEEVTRMTESPPAWFCTYMQNFKREILEEIKLEIEQKMNTLSSSSKNESEASAESKDESIVQLSAEFSLLDIASEKLKTSDIPSEIYCSHCKSEITGTHFKCGNCCDYNLCGKCDQSGSSHHRHDVAPVFNVVHKPESKAYSLKQLFREWNDKRTERGISASGDKHFSSSLCPHPSQTGISYMRASKSSRLIMDAEFLFDETVPDGSKFMPGSIFTKRWRVGNCGNRPWTKDTKLRFLWGTNNFTPSVMEVNVPNLHPGQSGSVEVKCTTPMRPGFYESHWNFFHKGYLFGDRIWCSIEVAYASPNTDISDFNAEQKLKCDEGLSAEGFVDNVQTDLENLPITSEAKMPNQIVVNDAEKHFSVDRGVNTESDVSSIASVTSDGEQEFVVVPMPPCFLIPGFNSTSSDIDQIANFRKANSTRTSASSSVIFLATPDDEYEVTEPVVANNLTGLVITENKQITDEHSYSKVLKTENEEIVSGAERLSVSEQNVENFEIKEETVNDLNRSENSQENPHLHDNANETVVQILPEGLVTAATMLFNSARSAISNVTRNSPPCRESSEIDATETLMTYLRQMGFYNRQLNYSVIEKHNGNADEVIDELLRRYDNDWYHHRH